MSQLFLPELPEPEIKLWNVRHFYNIYFVLIFIAFLVLLYELLHNQCRKLLEGYKNNEESVRLTRNRWNNRRIRRKFGVIGIMNNLKNRIFDSVIVI